MNKQEKYTELFKTSFLVRWSRSIANICCITGIALLCCSLYTGLILTKTDIQQGEHFRIIYVHVPSAWICMFLYLVLVVLSIVFIITTHPIASMISRIISYVGTFYTLITLITGSLWGYPMWGTFWVWDARLTSVLILFFIYVIHLFVINKKKDDLRNNKIAAFIAIVGFINIPIIKYSVEWWTTLHQGASIVQFKSAINTEILIPLLLVFIAFTLLTCAVVLYNLKKDILMKRIKVLHIE